MDQTNKELDKARDNAIAQVLTGDARLAMLKKISAEVNKQSFKLPKKSCKHCYGRGFTGYFNGIKSLPVPCRCTFIKKSMEKSKS